MKAHVTLRKALLGGIAALGLATVAVPAFATTVPGSPFLVVAGSGTDVYGNAWTAGSNFTISGSSYGGPVTASDFEFTIQRATGQSPSVTAAGSSFIVGGVAWTPFLVSAQQIDFISPGPASDIPLGGGVTIAGMIAFTGGTFTDDAITS